MEKKQLVPVSVKYLQGLLILRVVVLLEQIKRPEEITAVSVNELDNIYPSELL